ncbi:uncharacterized protein IL334_000329 [Kwoniella shivajii]|uniref:Magnesium transporter n=1 Tax=Kwoniella shivajii TaxID=564305 RepID=A0ABZ1CQB9_9TREE|nr:hypothetical protein IL334_000329 [Kwoniella shivajii]
MTPVDPSSSLCDVQKEQPPQINVFDREHTTTPKSSLAPRSVSLSVSGSENAKQCSDKDGLPDKLIQHLSSRLETGLDGTSKWTDPFIDTVKRGNAFVVARRYTSDTKVSQPVSQDMLNQETPGEQLSVLKTLIESKDVKDCLWVNALGIEEKLLAGLSELSSLPSATFYDHIRCSEHRHHRSHVEFHPSYTYIQLLVQDTEKDNDTSPIYDMIKDLSPIKGQHPSDMWINTVENKIERLIRAGFITVFIIPPLNLLVTITHPYYDCPASRLVVHTARMQMEIPGQLEVAVDARLLGLSIFHRTTGYASGVVRQVEKQAKHWEEDVKRNPSTVKLEEIHLIITNLNDFKKRLRQLITVNNKLKKHAPFSSSGYCEGQILTRTHILLNQAAETLERVIEDTDALVEKYRSLEGFVFNMISNRANDSMERLAIVTIVFLPLTFIASYFSMGFDDFPDLSRPTIYFWEISIPLSMAFFVIFAWSNLRRALTCMWITVIKLKKWLEQQKKWWKKDFELWWGQKVAKRDERKARERNSVA